MLMNANHCAICYKQHQDPCYGQEQRADNHIRRAIGLSNCKTQLILSEAPLIILL